MVQDCSKIASSIPSLGCFELKPVFTASKYTTVAAFTILIWDLLLTFPEEVQRVWKVRKTLGTTLFFINRYVPPIVFGLDLYTQVSTHLSSPFCRGYQLSTTFTNILSISVIEFVLILRTNALYQNKPLFIVLILMTFASVCNMMVLYERVYSSETFFDPTFDRISGCISACLKPGCTYFFAAFWIPFGVLESLVLALTAWKSYQSSREIRAIGGKTTIPNIIMRDGLLYFIVVVCITVPTIISFHFSSYAPGLLLPVFKCMQISICSRLMLNLRGVLDTSVGSQLSLLTDGGQATLLDLDTMRQTEPQEASDEDGIEYHTRSNASRTWNTTY